MRLKQLSVPEVLDGLPGLGVVSVPAVGPAAVAAVPMGLWAVAAVGEDTDSERSECCDGVHVASELKKVRSLTARKSQLSFCAPK
jgi:hypothetical protein